MMSKKFGIRIAFIVGNADYPGEGELANPTNDARAMRKKLTELGFKICGSDNLDYKRFQSAFDEFLSVLEKQKNTDTALLYFAGHGMQHNNDNFIVPIPDVNQAPRLVNVQDLMELTARHSKQCLLFLDACRTYPNKEAASLRLANERAQQSRFLPERFMVDAPVVSKKLSNIETAADTFMAFSAAPGQVALDGVGGSDLSPFTRALTEQMGAVDIPLHLMMARVRENVLEATNDGQRTWDNSSLTKSFFFNPSKILLLMGNALSLAAAVVAFILLALRLYEFNGWDREEVLAEYGVTEIQSILLAFAILTLAFILLWRGINRAYGRIKGRRTARKLDDRMSYKSLAFRGLIGGATGGIIGSWLMAWTYYFSLNSPDISFSYNAIEVTSVGVVVYSMVGIMALCLSEFMHRKFTGQRKEFRPKFTIVGSVFGGLIAALLTGFPAIHYFGNLPRNPMGIAEPVIGVLVCTFFVAFTIENYSLEKYGTTRLIKSTLAALTATVVSIIVFGFMFLLLKFAGLLDVLLRALQGGSNLNLAWLIFSLTYGPLMGMSIGLTRVLTARFDDKPTSAKYF